MLNSLITLLSPPPSPRHPTNRAQRKTIERNKSHFDIKDTALKAGVLACLIGVACYPSFRAGETQKKLDVNDENELTNRERYDENSGEKRRVESGRENGRRRRISRHSPTLSDETCSHDKTRRPRPVTRLSSSETRNIDQRIERRRPGRIERLLSFEPERPAVASQPERPRYGFLQRSISGTTRPPLFERFGSNSGDIGDGIRVRPMILGGLGSHRSSQSGTESLERPGFETSDPYRSNNDGLERPEPLGRLMSANRRLSARKFDCEWNSPSELESKR